MKELALWLSGAERQIHRCSPVSLPPRLDGHSLAQLTLRAHHRLVSSLLLLTVEGLPSHPPKHSPTPLLIKLLFTSKTT